MARHVWFGFDDFDFLFRRGLHSPEFSIWMPHNEHWSTIPILIYRAIFTFSGLRTALPYSAVNIAAHVALGHVLWRVMRLAQVEPMINAALAGVFLFLGSGAAGALRAFQIGFTGAVLLGWVFVLLENHESPSPGRRAAAATVSSLALMFSGVSITMVAVGGLVALIRRGWRAAVAAIAPAFAVFALWFILVGHRSHAAHGPIYLAVLRLPAYSYAGIVATFSGLFGSAAIGPVLLVLITVWLVARAPRTGGAVPALAGFAGMALFFFIDAFGRDQFGDIQASSDRYVAVAAALALPAVGLALTTLVRWSPRVVAAGSTADEQRDRPNPMALAVVLLALLLAALSNLLDLDYARSDILRQSAELERQMIAAVKIGISSRTIPGSYPLHDGLVGSPPDMSQLLAADRRGELPAGVDPNTSDTLTVATYLQLAVTPAALYPVGGARITHVSAGTTVRSGSPGCFSVTAATDAAEVRLAISSPTSIALRTLPGSVIDTNLSLPGLVGKGPVVAIHTPGPTSWFNVAAFPATVDVSLPVGTVLGPPC